MTVDLGLKTPATPKPTPAVPLFQKNTNKRWPPMANRNALPYKLTVMSKEKLAREATAPDPDLRRCVAHFRLHCGSVMWTENDMKSRMSSFEFEETDEEDENDRPEEKESFDSPQTTMVRVELTEPVSDASTIAIPPSLSPENALFDQSHCIEVTSSKENFCCISVTPIAG
ncbi:hypothetical protein N7462_011409 [Penicillium macrosclerotiorum]|uniref:uncharacterized protein n=1 Tax=Penicillium macrosclerotiorum TaxID=303699 RepID=UPI0025499D3B|nr:uncharacterized protein N7462_011409 [Penicillium macrosclerotiorum]KAJ5664596.1 hypothetical protein N7462_011409 [Penicillium macrosclerotiorum]